MTDTPVESTVVFRPTGHAWDAPVTVVRRHDGSTTITRDVVQDLADGFDFVWHVPHGVVEVDGVLSPYDAERQPPVDVWWRAQGYLFGRCLDERADLWLVVAVMVYNWRLMLCTPDGIDAYWCYPQDQVLLDDVVNVARTFDGVGDPPPGWVKQGRSKG